MTPSRDQPDIITSAPRLVAGGPLAWEIMETELIRWKLYAPAQEIFEEFPDLRLASMRLSWLITADLVYPITSKTILGHCLNSATRAAVRARENPGERMIAPAYLVALLQQTSMLLEIQVRNDANRWDPIADAPLAEWRQANPNAQVYDAVDPQETLLSPTRFMAGIALRVVEPLDLAALGLNDAGAREC